MCIFREFLADETGATSIEYGLIAVLIGIAIIAAAKSIGMNINELFGGKMLKVIVFHRLITSN